MRPWLALLLLLALLLALTTPALAAPPTRCLTYPEPSMGRWQTICDDGSRATTYWSPSLQQWTTTITPPPGRTCEGEGRCR